MDEIRPPLHMIRDMPVSQRPRERLRDLGVNSLRDDELIAILLRTGFKNSSVMVVAQQLITEFDGLAGLARASFEDLCRARGLGPAKAAELQAAMTLGIRAASVTPESRPLLKDPDAVARLMVNKLTHLDQEVVCVLSLDARLRLIKESQVYRGSVHATTVRYGELLRDPVRLNASAVVLVHNHPSGDPAPSAADVAMTKGMREASSVMDIDFHDHVVVGGGRFVSMRTAGLGFQ